MKDDEQDHLIAELSARPRERDRILQAAGLTANEHAKITELVEAADLLWLAAQEAPPLAEDPVAAMLGLLPDPDYAIAPRKLSQIRKRAGLSVGVVASRLRSRGWQVAARDVLAWETHSSADVMPAVVQALADLLGVAVDALVQQAAAGQRSEDELAPLRRDPLFMNLVDRWANARQAPRAVAFAELERRALASVHRGDRPSPEQVLQSLAALVSAIERAGEG